jgi:hypothetical protein
MDKNMIHIDDFVRQRLSGAEETERPGAWLQMRELLDDKMPNKKLPPFGFNWGRTFGYVGALLLAACVSIGGYEMFKSVHPEMQQALASNAVNNGAATPVAAQAAPTHNDVVANTHEVASVVAKTSVTHTDGNNNKPSHEATHIVNAATNTVAAATDHTTPAEATQTNPIAKADIKTENNNSPAKLNNTNTHEMSVSNDHPVLAAIPVSNKPTVTTATNTSATNNNTKNWTASKVPDVLYARTPAPKTTIHNETKHSQPQQANTVAAATNKINTTPSVLLPQSGNVAMNTVLNSINPAQREVTIIHKDSIPKMEIVYRLRVNPETKEALYVPDTVSVGYLVKETPVTVKVEEKTVAAAQPEEKHRKGFGLLGRKKNNTTAAESNITPAASAKATTTVPEPATINVAANSASNEVAKKEGHKITVYEECVRKLKDLSTKVAFDVSHASFNAGAVAGYNASFINGKLVNGFQFGLSALFTFDERWSAIGEVKYMQRMNNGMNIGDNYANNMTVTPEGTAFRVKGDMMEHYFNYSILSTIDLPVALRYTFGKFNILGGMNFACNLGVNDEEITHVHTSAINYLSATAPATFSGIEPAAKITSNDFAATTFGMSYVAGFGYQISPAFYADVRYLQQFYNSANTQGGKIISNTLYGMPMLQLTVGYRFNTQKK